MSTRAQPGRQRGLSMIELVVAIVVMSIISIGLMDFIMDSASSYSDAAIRNQVSASGRIVIERMAMEMHNALPESVRISAVRTTTTGDYYAGDQCLEFIPVRAATSYINPVFRPATPSSASFDVIDFVPAPTFPLSGVYAVIYPTDSTELYKSTFTNTESIVQVTVTDVTPGSGGHQLTPAAAHRFRRQSPVDRLFLVDQPVSYCLTGSKLYRYTNYGFQTTQLLPRRPNDTCASALCLPNTTPNRVLVSDLLDNSALTGPAGQAFDQLAANRRRNAVVQLDLNFSQSGQAVRLNHEVLLQATP